MAHEEILPWRRFSLRLNFSDIPILPQLLAAVPPSHVARLRRGLGCVWPRMLWLAEGLYTGQVDADATIATARPHDAFETTMWTLRHRLGLRDESSSWRTPVASCAQEPGDEAELDLDALRRAVRAEGAALSKDAAAVSEIIAHWQKTGDDKTFAMRTRCRRRTVGRLPRAPGGGGARCEGGPVLRNAAAKPTRYYPPPARRFFPSGVKIPGLKWTV